MRGRSVLTHGTAGVTARADTRHRWAGLVVVCLGVMMTFLNITQTASTLTPLQRDLHVSGAEVVWVASVYSMVVASLVLSAGTLPTGVSSSPVAHPS
jgi:DHA2 family multidrug resistance protein-like MFS transporter